MKTQHIFQNADNTSIDERVSELLKKLDRFNLYDEIHQTNQTKSPNATPST